MLVLTRCAGQQIVIGHNIRITVTAVKGDRVRLGIAAPESVRVDRAEVHQRRAAAGVAFPNEPSNAQEAPIATMTATQVGPPQPLQR
jgi:carbon storage regulator